MSEWRHDDLMRDLAAHLKQPDRLVWMDLQMGPHGSPRPDVFTLQKSFVRPQPTAYECKVSVSDFRSDVTSGKWQSYLDLASSVTFCVPKGLIDRSELPPTVGFMQRGDNGWITLKRPVRGVVSLKFDHMMKLLIDGFQNELGAVELRERGYREAHAHKQLCKKFGEEVANIVRDVKESERSIEYNRERAAAIIKSAEESARKLRESCDEEWAEIREIMDLPSDASRWDIQRAIRELRILREGGDTGELARIKEAMKHIKSTADAWVRQ